MRLYSKQTRMQVPINQNIMKRLLLVIIPFCLLLSCQNESIENSKEQIPVLAWYSIPHTQTTLARYLELKEAGFTHNLSFFPDAVTMKAAFDTAQVAGIKMIAYCPELKSKPEETVTKFMNHPALAAYMLRDEPNRKDFPELGEWAKKIISVDTGHFCYLNLFPNYASEEQLGTKTYKEHVDLFIDEVPIQVLSFDHYPVVGDSLRPEWYENLEIFSAAARNAGKPFWAFALSVAHGPYPIPEVSHMRLQVYSDLAYGAQGIEYFTYWTPYDTAWKFNNAPISLEGNRTESYDRVKKVNEEIKNLSYVFLGAKVVALGHTGEQIPAGTKRIGELPEPVKKISTEGTGAVVSLMENGKNNYLVVVNRDFLKPMKLTTEFKPDIYRISKDGSRTKAVSELNTIDIEPGDVAIFNWKK
jgi:hypothetical protein